MSYEQFATSYRRHTHFHRTLDEAYKTPEYCSAITIYKSESSKTWEHFCELVTHIIFIAIIATITFWILSA